MSVTASVGALPARQAARRLGLGSSSGPYSPRHLYALRPRVGTCGTAALRSGSAGGVIASAIPPPRNSRRGLEPPKSVSLGIDLAHNGLLDESAWVPEVDDNRPPVEEKAGFVLPDLSPGGSALLLALIAVGYGTNNTMVKTMQETASLEPLVLCFMRLACAAVALAPLTFVEGKLSRGMVSGGMELGLWLGGGYLLQALALTSTSVTNVGCIFTLATVMVPLLDWLFSGRPCSLPNQVASVVAFAGLYLLELDGGGLPQFVAGDMWALASMLSFAMHVVREHHWSSEVGHPLALGAIQMSTAAGLALGAVVLDSALHPGAGGIAGIVAGLPTINWGAMCWTGMICTGLVGAGELVALRNAQPVTAALIYNTVPLWGIGFAYAMRGDALPEGSGLLGAALIVGSGLTPFVVRKLLGARHGAGKAQGEAETSS